MSHSNATEFSLATDRDPDFGPDREMSESDFLAVKNVLGEQAAGSLRADGYLAPAVYLVTLGEAPGEVKRIGIMPVGQLVNQPQGKDIIVQIMEKMLTDANHDFVVFSHEAWVLKPNVDPANPGAALAAAREASKQSLEHHPDRGEAIVMQLRSKTRSALCISGFTRDADGDLAAIEDGELIFADTLGASMEGRMAPPAARRRGETLH